MRQKLVRMLGVFALLTPLAAPLAVRGEDRVGKVHEALQRLPSYGPFDLISFQDSNGTLTLSGAIYRASLRKEAETAIREVPGVLEVVNKIEVLPASMEDDRLRREVFVRIYSDPRLSIYGTPHLGSRGSSWGRRGLSYWAVEPAGRYAIHVVVKGSRVTLVGRVDHEADRIKAEMNAREVFGVLGVRNEIEVEERVSRS